MCVCFQTFHRRRVRVLVTVRACVCRPFSSRLSGRAPQDLHIHLKGLRPTYTYRFPLCSILFCIVGRIKKIEFSNQNRQLHILDRSFVADPGGRPSGIGSRSAIPKREFFRFFSPSVTFSIRESVYLSLSRRMLFYFTFFPF